MTAANTNTNKQSTNLFRARQAPCKRVLHKNKVCYLATKPKKIWIREPLTHCGEVRFTPKGKEGRRILRLKSQVIFPQAKNAKLPPSMPLHTQREGTDIRIEEGGTQWVWAPLEMRTGKVQCRVDCMSQVKSWLKSKNLTQVELTLIKENLLDFLFISPSRHTWNRQERTH